MSPKGRGRARLPPSPPALRRVFVIASSSNSLASKRLLAATIRACEPRFPVGTYATRRQQLRGERPQGSIDVLAPDDAAALYHAMHESAVLVVALSTISVLRDPSSTPPTRRKTIRLAAFVAHKALHALIEHEDELEEQLQRLATWPQQPGCDGENDPRVLPLHVFEADKYWEGLANPDVRKQFAKTYGAGGTRTDDGNKLWCRTPEYHGGQRSLHVAGRDLHKGMHWDVTSVKGKATLHTSNAVWHLEGSHGYVNVYPNATVDKSGGRSTAKLVWPRRR